MDSVLEFFKEFNIQTLIGVFLICGYFAKHIETKLESKIDAQITRLDAQALRTDKLYEMFVSLQKETKEMLVSAQKETHDMFISLLKEKR